MAKPVSASALQQTVPRPAEREGAPPAFHLKPPGPFADPWYFSSSHRKMQTPKKKKTYLRLCSDGTWKHWTLTSSWRSIDGNRLFFRHVCHPSLVFFPSLCSHLFLCTTVIYIYFYTTSKTLRMSFTTKPLKSPKPNFVKLSIIFYQHLSLFSRIVHPFFFIFFASTEATLQIRHDGRDLKGPTYYLIFISSFFKWRPSHD